MQHGEDFGADGEGAGVGGAEGGDYARDVVPGDAGGGFVDFGTGEFVSG